MSSTEQLLERISKGHTDALVALLQQDHWQTAISEQRVSVWNWLVYYNDVTGLRLLFDRLGHCDALDMNAALVEASFYGHWRVCAWLIEQGADVNYALPDTGETPLHASSCKAGRPFFYFVHRLLLKHGANPNVACKNGADCESFMRDVRTRGETPLHRAAAYGEAKSIALLIEHGADVTKTDAHGDSPISYASFHLRPGAILKLLEFDGHRIHQWSVDNIVSDHGDAWGDGMDMKFLGEMED